ncbi:hypothetical protein CJ307_25630 (plasmid) [Klebsiella quasipneumoniae]|nr:hypothetical protein CJ307_25630 [Klebsiella quasipneumoniae]
MKMPAFEWVHVQLHQQKGMISLSPPTICNSAVSINKNSPVRRWFDRDWLRLAFEEARVKIEDSRKELTNIRL